MHRPFNPALSIFHASSYHYNPWHSPSFFFIFLILTTYIGFIITLTPKVSSIVLSFLVTTINQAFSSDFKIVAKKIATKKIAANSHYLRRFPFCCSNLENFKGEFIVKFFAVTFIPIATTFFAAKNYCYCNDTFFPSNRKIVTKDIFCSEHCRHKSLLRPINAY